MNTRIFRRSLIAAGVLAAGLIAAPAAFARSHVSIGLGFYGPGVSVGLNDCVNCYRRPYYPAYYAPSAYYYQPAPVYYDPYPTYGTVYYGGGYYRGGGYYHRHWRDRDDWRGDRDDWRGRDRDHWRHH